MPVETAGPADPSYPPWPDRRGRHPHPPARRQLQEGRPRTDEQGPAHWAPHPRPRASHHRQRQGRGDVLRRKPPVRRRQGAQRVPLVVAWNRLAETCGKYLGKGQQVAVEGRISTRTWDDAANQRHWKTEIVANSVEMLSGRRKQDYAAETAASALEAQAIAAGLHARRDRADRRRDRLHRRRRRRRGGRGGRAPRGGRRGLTNVPAAAARIPLPCRRLPSWAVSPGHARRAGQPRRSS